MQRLKEKNPLTSCQTNEDVDYHKKHILKEKSNLEMMIETHLDVLKENPNNYFSYRMFYHYVNHLAKTDYNKALKYWHQYVYKL